MTRMQFRSLLSSLRLDCLSLLFVLLAAACSQASAAEPPRLVQKDGRYALLVDGKPFLILGGQIHNSSAWPSELPQVWESMAALHANTVEAPVYWEQLERQPGQFDFSNVDAVIDGARAHNLHVVLLWFGTWKNGNMHYAPAWVKTDTTRFPRVIRPDGQPIDVLSPISQNTLDADKAAFAALMHHLKQIDDDQHTVLLIQVENESGNIGSVRDFSPEANRLFALQSPRRAARRRPVNKPGTWQQVFGSDGDEMFQAYYQARYINEIAAAGKREFAIPCYINVWLDYPAAALPQRQIDLPGIGYPSGGAVQKLVDVWRKPARLHRHDRSGYLCRRFPVLSRDHGCLSAPRQPALDSGDRPQRQLRQVFLLCARSWRDRVLSFGVDQTGWNILGDETWTAHARNFALIAPMDREIAQFEFDGRLKTAVEEPGHVSEELDFGAWQATVAFGFPQPDGRRAPGTKDAHGAALVAQLGPNEFLVTGVDASIVFHLPGKLPWIRSQIVAAEQGTWENGVWTPIRLWNGDETDRGLCFYGKGKPSVVRVKMQKF